MLSKGATAKEVSPTQWIEKYAPYLRETHPRQCRTHPHEMCVEENKEFNEFARFWLIPYNALLVSLAGDFKQLEEAISQGEFSAFVEKLTQVHTKTEKMHFAEQAIKLCYCQAAANGHRAAFEKLDIEGKQVALQLAATRGYSIGFKALWAELEKTNEGLTMNLKGDLLELVVSSGNIHLVDWLIPQMKEVDETSKQNAMVAAVQAKHTDILWKLWTEFEDVIDEVTFELLIQEAYHSRRLRNQISKQYQDLEHARLLESVSASPSLTYGFGSEEQREVEAEEDDNDPWCFPMSRNIRVF